MEYTLLDIVQEILSDLDSDEVNSIDDTVESEQVASIVRSTYQAMMSNRDWPHLQRAIKLESLNDLSKPTHMKLADKVKSVSFINYNKVKQGETKRAYAEVKFLPPDQFIHKTNQEDSTSTSVKVVIDLSGIELLIRNDRAPTYYTSFDDEHVVFDSYDSSVDSVLIANKIQAQGYVMPTWTHTDSAIPDLPDFAFTALIEEAKSRASFRLKQVVDQKAEQESARQNRWISRKSRRLNGGIQYPSYGRGKVNIPKEIK
jgi:hypothetical protein